MNAYVPDKDYVPTTPEHIANCITHAIPALLSVLALLLMVYETRHSYLSLLGALPYGVGMFSTFFTSTSYHFSSFMNHKWTSFLKKCDHAIIYAFIATHYFPWILMTDVGKNNIMGTWFLLFVSLIAVMGLMKTIMGKFEFIPALVLYFSLGVVGLLLGPPMMQSSVAAWCIVDMLIGAVLYSLGVVIFKKDGIIPFAHAIWHLFVASAAAVHFHGIYMYIICMNSSTEITMRDFYSQYLIF
jgi:monocyte-to-macrophage differentiation protein